MISVKTFDDKDILSVSDFVGAHVGATAVIVGSSPTASLYNPETHKGHLTFSCNRGTTMPWEWDYGVVYDSITPEQKYYVPGRFNLRCFYHEALFQQSKIIKFMKERETSPIGKFCTMNNPFTKDKARPDALYRQGSSISILTQIACWMGCKQIYLYGVDMVSPPDKFAYFDNSKPTCNPTYYNAAGKVFVEVCRIMKERFDVQFFAKSPCCLLDAGLAEEF